MASTPETPAWERAREKAFEAYRRHKTLMPGSPSGRKRAEKITVRAYACGHLRIKRWPIRRAPAAIHFRTVTSVSSKAASSNRVAGGSTSRERVIVETTVSSDVRFERIQHPAHMPSNESHHEQRKIEHSYTQPPSNAILLIRHFANSATPRFSGLRQSY